MALGQRRTMRDRFRQWLGLPVSFLLLVFLIYTDAGRLHTSAIWGTSDWLLAAMAGLAVALLGLIMAALSIRRQRHANSRTGAGQRFPVLGVGYTVAMAVVFVLTHWPHGPQPAADTPIMVAALAAQIILAVCVALTLVAIVGLMVSRRVTRHESPQPER